MKLKNAAITMNQTAKTMTPQELISKHNLNKVAGVCRRYGCAEVPEALQKLTAQLSEQELNMSEEAFTAINAGKQWKPEDAIQELKATKAVATLPGNFSATLKGGKEVRDGEYAVRLSTVEDTHKGGRILVVTAPELCDGIKAEHAKNHQKEMAERAKRAEEHATFRIKKEEAEKERVARNREHQLFELGIQPSEELRNFLNQLPTRARVTYDGARERVKRIVKDNDPSIVKTFGADDGNFFAVTIDNGGWLSMTIFANGIDYISDTVKRLSMTPDEASEIQAKKDLPKAPVAFDRPVPEDILRKIAEELPHDRKYIPYFHVFTWKEAFNFAENAVKVQRAKQGESIQLLLQGESKVAFVTLENYCEDGSSVSGVVPIEFDDERPCAFVSPRNGAVTIYLPD